ncbi:hypothetical protein [Nitrincola nitratireducens]|uniref:Uncharacterized protein n=1 Tax=Nitrincola nitratireducens TaxID=1229521 RepID=W9UTS7_9GAMM|nr:hypothetical protein [Nitrincola nitratireducens]EXJ10633.1 hypothetical protein D791_02464 [Nitrincola nitratireducens]
MIADDKNNPKIEADDKGLTDLVVADTECNDNEDDLAIRLQCLTIEFARERALLSEKISQLQEENDQLKFRIEELICSSDVNSIKSPLRVDATRHPEHLLGLDFSIPSDSDS